MPWQPFRRRVKHKPLRDEVELETCFDDQLSRSLSDGNLVRAPSERFLLSNLNQRRSYGTCSSNSNTSHWTSFTDHTVGEGDTLAGLSLRFDITIQDIKLANSLWTNEGLYTGRVLRIPIVETGSTNLDLTTTSDSVSSSSRKSSTDHSTSRTSTGSTSRTSADLLDLTSDVGGSAKNFAVLDSRISVLEGRNSSVNNNCTCDNPSCNTQQTTSCNTQQTTSCNTQQTTSCNTIKHKQHPELGRRASVDELKDFLKKMDMSIAMGKKATSSMVNKSLNTTEADNY